MHITIVQGAFLPIPPLLGGAVEKMWFALVPEFVRHGHEVTYVSRRFPDLPDDEVRDGVRHVRVPGFDAPRSTLLYRACDAVYAARARARLPAADILVTNTIFLPVLVRGERAGRLCVYVARYPKGQMWLYRHAARLQTVSEAVATAIRAELPARDAGKVAVIPLCLGGDPAPLTEPELAAPRDPVVLYLGRIHPEKGLDLLLRAFGEFIARLPADAPRWRLQLIGPHDARRGGGGEAYRAGLDALAAPFRDRVEWLGFMTDAEMNARCRRASVFVYPSVAERGESFGVAPLEAMAQGCPAVVSDLACFRDYLHDGETGLVFDHRAPRPDLALADVLGGLAADPALRERLARAGYAQAREFTREAIAARYLQDFAALLAERPAARR